MKRLGNSVKGYIPQQWERDRARNVTYRALVCKFGQNADLLQKLKATGKKTLVEASRELPWGCGVSLNHPGVLDSTQWHGPGLKSEILSQIREEVK